MGEGAEGVGRAGTGSGAGTGTDTGAGTGSGTGTGVEEGAEGEGALQATSAASKGTSREIRVWEGFTVACGES